MKKYVLGFLAASSLFAAPQAIVFDFGGVMTKMPERETIVRFLQSAFQITETDLEKIKGHDTLADQESWLSFAEEKKIDLSKNWTRQVRGAIRDAIGINTEMYQLVAELKEKGVRVALLSNVNGKIAKMVRGFGFYEPFDPCLLSCDIGFEKPSQKAFEALMDKLSLPAREIIFIDDRIENIEGAKKAGIDAILFESVEQVKRELSKREL